MRVEEWRVDVYVYVHVVIVNNRKMKKQRAHTKAGVDKGYLKAKVLDGAFAVITEHAEGHGLLHNQPHTVLVLELNLLKQCKQNHDDTHIKREKEKRKHVRVVRM